MNILSAVILLGALQGFYLFFAMRGLSRGDARANSLAAWFILLVSLALLGRYAYTAGEQSILFSKILFLGDVVIFFYGPLLYLYFTRRFTAVRNSALIWLHFLPLTAYIVILIPPIVMEKTSYIEWLQSSSLLFLLIEVSAIVQNSAYAAVNLTLLRRFERSMLNSDSSLPQLNFYKILLATTWAGVFFWVVSFVVRWVGPPEWHSYLGYQLVWISLSSMIIALGYYILRNPEAVTPPVPDSQFPLSPEEQSEMEAVREKIDRIMSEKKPFLEQRLTLPMLAETAGVTTHLLSRVINESYSKNFFEFINTYRVEELKKIATPERLKAKTLYSLALDAGFNSKSTFNAAFKRITGTTPGEYFRSRQL